MEAMMSLALGARLGDTFLIGNQTISLVSIDNAAQVTVERDDGRSFAIFTNRMAEVLSDVFICIGSEVATHHLRLVFDAPRTISITRCKRVAA
jgi:hypothetical protein